MIQNIFAIENEDQFNSCALAVFKYQAKECAVYKQYINLLGLDVEQITQVNQIPFLPIQFFKSHLVYAHSQPHQIVFESSGTGLQATSKHYVADKSIYQQSYTKAFELFYGSAQDYTILALLPSYLERTGSSLIDMVDGLIGNEMRGNNKGGFYLHNHDELYKQLMLIKQQGGKCLLIGVSFALLDFAETYPINFPDLLVMETGGMKGKRTEIPRSELHAQLTKAFGVTQIHSEYGMTELLSQAYSQGEGYFSCPPWMRVVIRDLYDPFLIGKVNGGINVIDLANLYSCSFIETQDQGRIDKNGCFEVLGRLDHSEIRGCNLLLNE